MSKRALFIGRWQPFHKGHLWLIKQKLDKGIPVLIAIRDVPVDENNPLQTEQVYGMLRLIFAGQDVEVIVIPDIESVNWGKDAGFELNQHINLEKEGQIAAEDLVRKIQTSDLSWKDSVVEVLHDNISHCLRAACRLEDGPKRGKVSPKEDRQLQQSA